MRTSSRKRVERGRVRRPASRQELERHRLAELQVVGAVDLAHAAAAEQPADAIASRQHRARDEPAVDVTHRTGHGSGGRADRGLDWT